MIQRVRSALLIVSSIAGVLFLGPAVSGQDRTKDLADTVRLPRGMVADLHGLTGFVPSAGAIDAVDLQTGKVLWTTKAASRPLLVRGDQLVALARAEGPMNTVRVVVLDASPKAKGKRVRESQHIELSEWLIPRVPETALDRGDLLLRWQATQYINRGKFGAGPLVHKHLARINLTTGRVEKMSDPDLPAPKLPREIASVKGDHYFYEEGNTSSKPVIVEGKVAAVFDPFFFGEKYLEEVAKEFGEKGTDAIAKTALRRWDLASGKEQKPVILLQSVGVSLRISPDKRYVFAPILRKDLYHWTIHSLETGQQVGTITSEGTSEMGLLGTRVYVSWGDEEKRELLIARDLKSGKQLWTLQLHTGR
jgi:hypothetical protein